MERLSTLLPRTLHKHGFAEEARASLLTHKAASWIDSRLPELRSSCAVRTCREHELTIACDSSTAAHALSERVAELEEHLSPRDAPQIRVRITRATSLAKGG